MTGGTARIVPMSDELEPAVLALWDGLWRGGRRRNAAYLRWKFTENRTQVPDPIVVAMVGERVVGLAGAHGTRWQAGPARETVPCLGDLMVAEDLRGSDVFGLLVDAAVERLAEQGHRFVFDYARGQYVPTLLLRGWSSIGPLTQAIRRPVEQTRDPMVVRATAGLAEATAAAAADHPDGSTWSRARAATDRLAFHVGGGSALARAVRLRRAPKPGRRPPAGIEVSSSVRAEAMADLVHRLPTDDRLRAVRDRAFFAWRYRNPLADYRFCYAGGQVLDGYLALSAARTAAGERHGVVADLEATSETVRWQLLEAAAGFGLSSLTVWPRAGTDDEDQLERMGFGVERPTGRAIADIDRPTVLVRRLGSAETIGPSAPGDVACWDPRMAYFDEV